MFQHRDDRFMGYYRDDIGPPPPHQYSGPPPPIRRESKRQFVDDHQPVGKY